LNSKSSEAAERQPIAGQRILDLAQAQDMSRAKVTVAALAAHKAMVAADWMIHQLDRAWPIFDEARQQFERVRHTVDRAPRVDKIKPFADRRHIFAEHQAVPYCVLERS
jgi:hypothetical protein